MTETVTYSATPETLNDLTFILDELPRFYTKSRIIRELIAAEAKRLKQLNADKLHRTDT